MPGLYTHPTRTSGTILTSTIYNADHQNHIDNAIPQSIDDYSSSEPQMQTVTNPGQPLTPSLPVSLAGEIERLRYVIKEMKGTAQWYGGLDANKNLTALAVGSSAKNIFRNGGMRVNQRAAGTVTADGSFPVDMVYLMNTATNRINARQMNTGGPLSGSIQSIQMDVHTPGAPAAGDVHGLQFKIEGTDIAHLKWGTVNAKTIAISFWLQNTSLLGQTISVAVRNGDITRSYVTTITGTAGWGAQTVVIPGDTSGTWLTDTGIGMSITITLGCGSTRTTATLNAWQGGNFVAANTQTQISNDGLNPVVSVSNFKVEEGSFSTRFTMDAFEEDLRRCQRYFFSSYPVGVAGGTITMQGSAPRFIGATANLAYSMAPFPTPMRITPTTINTWNPSTGANNQLLRLTDNAAVALTSMQWDTKQPNTATATGLLAASIPYAIHFHASAEL